MDYTYISLLLLLHVFHFTEETGNDFLFSKSTQKPIGPLQLSIIGPKAVTVGVPCSFICAAQCSPECNYTIGIEGQGSGQGNELAFTLSQWGSPQTVICTARNPTTGASSSISKTFMILVGPVNVSMSGPQFLTPGETQQFLCNATCKPSCTYSWIIDGVVKSSGNEMSMKPSSRASDITVVCQATNTVSGLFAAAVRKLNVAGVSGKSSSERVELLRKLLFACVMSAFLLVLPL
ncbi:kin of IRRE-like protein 2 [Hoplias malabaricus]|uniref:kin of IRRE-like protein 2 n=1 Tax=Hoplias malabaricus TaxID=27720 RepID=UPI003462304F